MEALTEQPEGKLLADCKRLLAEYERRFEQRPEEQHRRLCLLALEREQLVSFAYREDVLARRLTECEGPAEVLDLFRYALRQVWRDEEAHTVFIRGELVRDGRPGRTVAALAEQAAGLLSGWSAALKHHVPRSAAPLRSCLVDGLALGARVVGKLSPDLRAELGYKSFADYCRYNIDAEQTAEFCWRRLVELDDRLGLGNRSAFERIAAEETQHRRVFALIADSLDDHDRVRPGSTPESVIERLAAIDSRLIDPDHRGSAMAAAPREGLGVGGTVHVIDGDERSTTGTDGGKVAALDTLLGRLLPSPADCAGRRVAVKTSWMMGYSRLDRSTITDTATLLAIARHLRAAGAAEVTLLDGPNVYSDLYHNRKAADVAAHFGIDRLGVPIADSNDDVVPLRRPAAFGPTHVSRIWREAELRISVTRLRSHPTEHAHLTTANLEGLIADSCRNVFWTRSYDYSASSIAVGVEAPPTVAIIDAWDDCPDGWFGIMAGPRPKHPRRLYGGHDCLAVDLVALRHTGSDTAIDSPTLRRAIEWFGDPRPRTTIEGPDEPIPGWRNPYRNAVSGLLADLSYPVYSWLSRSGAIFAPPMDAEFVEARPLPRPLRLARRLAQPVLGLHPPRRSNASRP